MGTTVCPISGRELNSITKRTFLIHPARVPLKVGLLDRERPITIDDNEADDDDDDEKGFVCCDISKPRSGSEGRDGALISR